VAWKRGFRKNLQPAVHRQVKRRLRRAGRVGLMKVYTWQARRQPDGYHANWMRWCA